MCRKCVVGKGAKRSGSRLKLGSQLKCLVVLHPRVGLDSLLLGISGIALHPERGLSSLALSLRVLDILGAWFVDLAAESVTLELECVFVVDLGLGDSGILELGMVFESVSFNRVGELILLVLAVRGHCDG
jgi:hypothetical protein